MGTWCWKLYSGWPSGTFFKGDSTPNMSVLISHYFVHLVYCVFLSNETRTSGNDAYKSQGGAFLESVNFFLFLQIVSNDCFKILFEEL